MLELFFALRRMPCVLLASCRRDMVFRPLEEINEVEIFKFQCRNTSFFSSTRENARETPIESLIYWLLSRQAFANLIYRLT